MSEEDTVNLRSKRKQPASLAESFSSEDSDDSVQAHRVERRFHSKMPKKADGSATKVVDDSESPASTEKHSVNLESCPICFESLKYKHTGTPEACEHRFCIKCIKDWAMISNTCPLDRKVFNVVRVRVSCNGKYIKNVSIQELLADKGECKTCPSCGIKRKSFRCPINILWLSGRKKRY